MKQKTKNRNTIIIVVILAVAIIFFFNPLNLSVMPIGPYEYTVDSLISENDKSAIYELNVNSYEPRRHSSCMELPSIDIPLNINSYPQRQSAMAPLVDNLQKEVFFKGEIITLEPLIAQIHLCSDITRNVNSEIVDKTMKCKLENREKYAFINCVGSAKGYALDNGQRVNAGFSGLQTLKIRFEVLKNGVQCTETQLTLCSEGQICEDNICVDSYDGGGNDNDENGMTWIIIIGLFATGGYLLYRKNVR